jgi:hypothetical protein
LASAEGQFTAFWKPAIGHDCPLYVWLERRMRLALIGQPKGTAMSMYYSHTLIPDQANYIPHPRQVADFYSVLIDLGAAPRQAELLLWTEQQPPRRTGFRTGRRERKGMNPASGQPICIVDYMTTIDSVSIIGPALECLEEYKLEMHRIGPLKPLFQFDDSLFKGEILQFDEHCPEDQSYEFKIYCCLQPDVVSMSDYHVDDLDGVGKTPEGETVMPFGHICSAANRTGFFSNPKTMELIRVTGAGCARFWIEFAFGKWLFPKDDSLDLLPANVVDAAQQIFRVRYLQGCHWG